MNRLSTRGKLLVVAVLVAIVVAVAGGLQGGTSPQAPVQQGVTPAQFAGITPGMTTQQVDSALGMFCNVEDGIAPNSVRLTCPARGDAGAAVFFLFGNDGATDHRNEAGQPMLFSKDQSGLR